MPRHYPRYPLRDQVVAYLEEYAARLQLAPRFGQTVASIEPTDGGWMTRTPQTSYRSRYVVIATGYTRQPHRPAFPGLERFGGTVLHSRDYRSGAAYRGQAVLVVGLGNSGGEIALDLYEHGARPAVAVRGAVNVLPRDLCGLPVLALAVYASKGPPAVSDWLFAPLISWALGDIAALGLRKLPYGPLQQIARDRRVPLLDVGTLQHIRDGHIAVYPGIARFGDAGVVFADGRDLAVDTVVLATGYRPALRDFLPVAEHVTDAAGVPLISGREAALPGLFFCGFHVAPTGMLREIGIEAQRIARAIAAGRPTAA